MRIEVAPYDPAWPGVFAAIRADLVTALDGVPIVGIEHVGSTSVPGLAAKPVIDVDIIVDAAEIEAAILALEAVGYRHLGDLGIRDRQAFRAPDGPRRNVYVVLDDSLALRNHLGVRRVLRDDPDLRRRYEETKLRLARTAPDIDAYVEAKIPILQEILAAAGLDENERTTIATANRSDDAPRPAPAASTESPTAEPEGRA